MNRLSLIAFSIATLAACGRGELLSAQPVPFDATNTVRADRDFAARLYATQRARPGNLFFSPASVRVAMAMVYSGARGETAAEMTKAVGLSRDRAYMNAHFGAQLKGWNRLADSNIKLKVTGQLWGQAGAKFLSPFLDGLRDAFGAPLEQLDFYEAPEPSRLRINAWVENATEHLIKDLLGPGTIKGKGDGDRTRLVVTNAIYFKGKWQTPFQKGSTTDAPFHVAPGIDVQAPLMSMQSRFDYGEYDGTKLVALPYGKGTLTMIVLLPDDRAKLGPLEKAFDGRWLETALRRVSGRTVNLTIPKFSTTMQASLKDALSRMGMPLAFDRQRADLSGMDGVADPDRRLVIDDVIHKAYVAVDEQGTEAAAATAVHGIMPISGEDEELIPPVVFRADHPFVYLICDKPGSVLFMGRLNDPTKNGSD